MDLHLLLTSHEAIEYVCSHDKAKMESSKKASHKGLVFILCGTVFYGTVAKIIF
jgi:hypothetical protein